MILILSSPDDAHTDAVIGILRQRGAPYFRFETAKFPLRTNISCSFDNGRRSFLLSSQGTTVDLGNVSSVWYRRPQPPELPTCFSERERKFASSEARRVLGGLWQILADRLWVNPYDSTRAAENKPFQLFVAEEVGLAVPRTLMTNNPDEALSFFDSCCGAVVYKAFSPYPPAVGDEEPLGLGTTVLDRSALAKTLDSIRVAPCIFQEYVPKRFEYRITVIGDEIFAAEIDSQSNPKSLHDFREAQLEIPFRPAELPARLMESIRLLIRRLHLVFGCIDMILTPDGRFVFLEINPNGQWLFVEYLAGLKLADAIASLLESNTRVVERHRTDQNQTTAKENGRSVPHTYVRNKQGSTLAMPDHWPSE